MFFDDGIQYVLTIDGTKVPVKEEVATKTVEAKPVQKKGTLKSNILTFTFFISLAQVRSFSLVVKISNGDSNRSWCL